MSIFETIRKRRSVRTFDGAELRPEDGDRILEYAEKAENPYGIRIAWRLLDAKEYGLSSPVIMGTDTFIAGKMSRVPHAEEAFGYSFEEVVLYAETLGVGTTWIAGTMNRSAFEKAMQVSDGEVMPCISPLGYPAERMSLRESLMRRGIRADSRLDFGEVFFDGGLDWPPLPRTGSPGASCAPQTEFTSTRREAGAWMPAAGISRRSTWESPCATLRLRGPKPVCSLF